MKTKNIIRIALVVGIILLVPLVAMQFTSEVVWNLADFVIMGILLFVTGLAIELTWEKLVKSVYRISGITVIIITFLIIWAELAVGLFGTPWAGS